MISRKCCAQVLSLIVAINLVHYTSWCQAKIESGDKKSMELTTPLPEAPQSDMFSIRPQLNKSDACYSFTWPDFEKKTFFSPRRSADDRTYTNGSDCVLVLEAPPGHLIKLDFRDYFHIEPSPECKNDFLEVRDGPHGYNELLENPFCGEEFPPILTSSDRHLWIHFKSDENIEYRGFKAVFEYIPRPPTLQRPEVMPCTMELTDLVEGVFGKSNISSEIIGFTTENSMPIDCIWGISVPNGWRIHLQFQRFELEKPNECEKNFIQVFSSRTDMTHVDKKFCGSIADSVLSKENIMYFRFFADYQAYKSYVEANFTAFRDGGDSNNKAASGKPLGCNEETEFDCEDATCISITLRCNGRYNCRFRWDEDECQGGLSAQSLSLTDDHIVIIMIIFSLILSGMCITFVYNCVKKLIRDHQTIQEYIRQSREQQLNELDKQEQADKKTIKSRSSSPSNSHQFDGPNTATPCYVPGGELLPILIRNERSVSPPNGDAFSSNNIYTVDNETMPEMCDSACQTRESLFTTQGYNSDNSTPNHSIHTNSPPAPFSTFGYKKDNKFKAEAKIEVAPNKKNKYDDKRRPYSVQTRKSAPDVIVTH